MAPENETIQEESIMDGQIDAVHEAGMTVEEEDHDDSSSSHDVPRAPDQRPPRPPPLTTSSKSLPPPASPSLVDIILGPRRSSVGPPSIETVPPVHSSMKKSRRKLAHESDKWRRPGRRMRNRMLFHAGIEGDKIDHRSGGTGSIDRALLEKVSVDSGVSIVGTMALFPSQFFALLRPSMSFCRLRSKITVS